MGNLRETSQAYVPKKTKNIADLEAVSLDVSITKQSGTDKDGKNFEYYAADVAGEDYRVPSSVLEAIQTLLETKPEVKTIKVVKKGTGMNSTYSVIELE
jgi:hypothetical protein